MPSVLRCIECHTEVALDQIVYNCPKCGSLFEIAHPNEVFADKVDALKARFAERSQSRRWAAGSGVWRYHEWVLPDLPPEHRITLGEGNGALTHIQRADADMGLKLWVKQCGHSHTGSFKDLGMTVLVSWVHHLRKQGKGIEAVLCASTGDTSAALAAYGAAAGIPVVVLLPKGKVSEAQLLQPLAHGARVVAVDGDFDDCMRHVQSLAEDPRFYLANSKNSLRIEGQKTVAYEIAQDLEWQIPDWVAIPGGNLGNVSALVRGFADLKRAGLIPRTPRILCAQAQVAAPLFESFKRDFEALNPVKAGETYANAIRIGNPVSYPRAVKALQQAEGIVDAVSEADIAGTMRRFDALGFYLCPHTAVAMAAVHQQRQAGVIAEGDEVVVVSTAHGLKFSEAKRSALHEHLGNDQARGAIEVANDLRAVKAAALGR